MERSRKKSSKQALEEKQMKRYHRSKKRSQIRNKNDNEEKADGISGVELTESSTVRKQNPRAAEQRTQSVVSINNRSTTPKTSREKNEIRKALRQVIASDSIDDSTSRVNTETKSQLRIKKETITKSTTKTGDLYSQKKDDIHSKSVETLTENIKTTDKDVSIEDLTTEQTTQNDNQTTDETLMQAENLKFTKDHLMINNVNDRLDSDMPETNECTMNLQNTTNTSNPLDKKLKELQGTHLELKVCSQQNEEKTLNEGIKTADDCTEERQNSVEVSTNKALDHKTIGDDIKQKETLSMEKFCLLDSDNVWLDKYKYNDAEKQYHQQAALKKDTKSDTFEKTSKHQEDKEINLVQLEKDEDTIEKTTIVTTEKSLKAKPRVRYEIFEEIKERTEITYQIVDKETEDVFIKEHLTKFQNQNVEFEQYLTELGGYVKKLEDRVKILEKGENISLTERSASLSSNTSDEGVDMLGGSMDLISSFKRFGQTNGKCESNMKDLTVPLRNKNGILGL